MNMMPHNRWDEAPDEALYGRVETEAVHVLLPL